MFTESNSRSVVLWISFYIICPNEHRELFIFLNLPIKVMVLDSFSLMKKSRNNVQSTVDRPTENMKVNHMNHITY